MKHRLIFPTAAIAVFCLVLTSCGRFGRTIRLGTAGTGGTYYVLGETMADLLSTKDTGLDIQVRETAGSAANLRLLSGNYIQLALAQTDVIHDAWTASGPFEGNLQNGYRALAGLYTEACQVVARKDSGLETIRDLQDKRVCIGEEESGTEQNALQILSAYGLNDKTVKLVNMKYSEAAEALVSGEIDAFFCTAGMQTAFIEELASKHPIRFLPVDGRECELILSACDYYVSCEIPAGTYSGQEEEIETIGVRSVLLATDDLSAGTVQKITEEIFAHAEELQAALPAGSLLTEESAIEQISIPFHKGALEYYRSRGIQVPEE